MGGEAGTRPDAMRSVILGGTGRRDGSSPIVRFNETAPVRAVCQLKGIERSCCGRRPARTPGPLGKELTWGYRVSEAERGRGGLRGQGKRAQGATGAAGGAGAGQGAEGVAGTEVRRHGGLGREAGNTGDIQKREDWRGG